MRYRILLLIMCWLSVGIVNGQSSTPKREMRAVWIATVANIDWPSKSGLSVKEQQKELLDQLDMHKKNGMNAVVFQVRPATDAFYKSPYEPWSQWLTGEQGKAPDPVYDPLAFAIEQCHKRGMELHAWLNPYRALCNEAHNHACAGHITNQKPEMFLSYGKNRYFNPGLKQTRDYFSRVVSDIVRRYDVDAIHFDDYFYPYKIRGKEFPDRETFNRFPRGFAPDELEDWRRENVDLIIHQVHDSIKQIKPWVRFGISPFGVWRNSNVDPLGSATKAGQTNYDDLYADVIKWCRLGWIDYVTPQIYWHIGKKVADYKVLLKWWNNNSYGRNLYIGQGAYRVDSNSKTKAWRKSRELPRQVKLNRRASDVHGSMFFSSKSFRNNPLGISDIFRNKLYRYPALVPENNSVKREVVDAPSSLQYSSDGRSIVWQSVKNARWYVVYRFKKHKKVKLGSARNIIGITGTSRFDVSTIKRGRYKYVVTAVSRTNRESDPSEPFGL